MTASSTCLGYAVTLGAMLFATSDLPVARERFFSKSFLNSA